MMVSTPTIDSVTLTEARPRKGRGAGSMHGLRGMGDYLACDENGENCVTISDSTAPTTIPTSPTNPLLTSPISVSAQDCNAPGANPYTCLVTDSLPGSSSPVNAPKVPPNTYAAALAQLIQTGSNIALLKPGTVIQQTPQGTTIMQASPGQAISAPFTGSFFGTGLSTTPGIGGGLSVGALVLIAGAALLFMTMKK